MAQGYTFQIVFSGLCALVPDKDLDAGEKPTRVDVLLVDSKDKAALKLPTKHEPHFPLLRFKLSDAAGNFNGAAGESYGMWTLENEDLSLEVRNVTTKQISTPDELVVDPLKNVPRIASIMPDHPDLDPLTLSTNPQTAIARFAIEQGRLVEFKLAQFLGEDVLGAFVPPPENQNPVIQKLAHKVALQLDLEPDEEVVIHARDFGLASGAPDSRQLVLGPVPGVVTVEITNLCCGYFLQKDEDFSDLPEADDDFDLFYILLKDFGDTLVKEYTRLPIPVPISYKAKNQPTGAGGAEPIRCNLALFKAPTSSGAGGGVS